MVVAHAHAILPTLREGVNRRVDQGVRVPEQSQSSLRLVVLGALLGALCVPGAAHAGLSERIAASGVSERSCIEGERADGAVITRSLNAPGAAMVSAILPGLSPRPG